jgi:exodeoxyribonuclease V alpha subunit
LPTDELVPLAEKLLEVLQQLIRTALELELQEGTVIADQVGETPCVFLAGLYRAERTIAHRLILLANGTLPWPWIDSDKALPWVEKHIGFALAESQIAAIRLALMSKVLVMTGGPGVGKTTIVKAILRILGAKSTGLLLCAPTGRAAKRMTEATGFEAKTIHRLLEVDPKNGGFRRGDHNPLDCDLLVIDEASMVDVMLMQALLRAVPDKTALLIVGDIDQLPSSVSRTTGTVPDEMMSASTWPGPTVGHSTWMSRMGLRPNRFGMRVFASSTMRLTAVAGSMNRGGVGARSLNIELQAALNPAGDRKVERFGWTFASGDKVMQIENDYDKEVYNGDIGTIDDVDANAGELAVSFDGRSVKYGFGELDTLVPAYAATIHKSQGSEYPAVIIPVLTQHYTMLQRNLLYTGVTRGKRLVVLVGQKKAIAIAVRNVSGRRRWSKLAEWLRPGLAD